MTQESATALRLIIAGVVLLVWVLFSTLTGKFGERTKNVGIVAIILFAGWLLFSGD
jgi:hypothetical protein